MAKIISAMANNITPGPKRLSEGSTKFYMVVLDGDPALSGCRCPIGTIAIYNDVVSKPNRSYKYFKYGKNAFEWNLTASSAPGGGSSSVASAPDWAGATGYLTADMVKSGIYFIRRIANGTSAASFSAAEAAAWSYMGQSTIPAFSASTVVVSGGLIRDEGVLWQRISAGTTGGAFNLAEKALWNKITATSLTTWGGSTSYLQGELAQNSGVTLLRIADGTSAATFTAAEAGDWTYVGQSDVSSFSGSSVYVAGTQISEEGVLWSRLAAGTSGATFNSAEKVFWGKLTASSVSLWTGSLPYLAGEISKSGSVIMRRTADGTSAASFTAAEAGAWSYISQDSVSGFSAASVYIAGEQISEAGVLWERIAAGTSGASFDVTEKAFWNKLTKVSLESWVASEVYALNELVLNSGLTLRRNSAGTSAATFTLAEASAWDYISQSTIGAFSGSSVYNAGTLISESGSLWERILTGTSGASFDSAEMALWSKLTTSSVINFAGSTDYLADEIVYFSGLTLKRVADGTSAATFTLAEAGNWILLAQEPVSGFSGAAVYPAGVQISEEGVLWERISNGLSGASFDLTEKAFWSKLTYTSIGNFAGDTAYLADEVAYFNGLTIRRVADGTSAATFTLAEAANWVLLAQEPVASFVGSTVYVPGFQISEEGSLWERTALGTSGASFDATEKGLWSKLTDVTIGDWAAQFPYALGNLVVNSNVELRRTSAGTSAATFTLVEAGDWELISQKLISAWVATTVYMLGEIVIVEGSLYSADATFTSAAGFDFTSWTKLTSSSVQAWVASTDYVTGDLVSSAGVYLLRTSAGTSTASFNTAEAGAWTYVSQLSLNAFSATTVYPAGVKIVHNGSVYESSIAFTSGLTFSSADWDISHIPSSHIPVWVADLYYETGGIVLSGNKLIRRVTSGVSEAAFDLTEAGTWTIESQDFTPWSPSTLYMADERISSLSAVWERIAAGTSGLLFDAAESADWTRLYELLPSANKEGQVASYSSKYSGYTSADGTGIYLSPADPIMTGWAGTLSSIVSNASSDFRGETEYNLSDASAVAILSGDSIQFNSLHLANTSQTYEFAIVKGVGTAGVIGQFLLQDATVTTDFVSIDFDPNALSAAAAFQASAGGNATVSIIYRNDTGSSFRIIVEVLRPTTSVGVWTSSIKPARSLTLGGADDATLTSIIRTAAPRIDLHDASSGQRYHLLQPADITGDLGSGLVKRGDVTADGDVGEGIYGFDASGGVFDWTLPSATGSQERRILISNDVASNNVTIKVQVGESLNDAIDGTFTCQIDSQVLYAIDRAAGEWALQVLGAGASTSLGYAGIIQASTDASITFPYSILFDDTAGDSSGVTANVANNRLEITEDGVYDLSFSASLQSVNSVKTLLVQINGVDSTLRAVTNAASGSATSIIGGGTLSLVSGDLVTMILRTVVGDAGVDVTGARIFAKRIPSNEVVLAGMVIPTELPYGRLSKTDGVSQDSNAEITFNEATYSSGVTASVGSNSLTVITAGRYRIEAMLNAGDFNLDYDLEIRKNGVAIEIFAIDVNPGAATNTFSFDADLVAADVITLTGISLGDTLTFKSGGTSAYLDIRRIPESTVVNPATIVPVTLHRTRMRRVAAQSIVAGAITTIAFDAADFNIGSIGNTSTGLVTIAQAGTYRISAGWKNNISQNNIRIQIGVDGTIVGRGGRADPSSGGVSWPKASVTLDLSVGQAISVDAFIDATTQDTATSLADQPFVEVIQLADYTVIDATDVVVTDAAASGYMDIGTMRMQWGPGVAGTPIVFPVPFSSAPSVVATVEGNSSDRIVAVNVPTTTGVSITSFNTGSNTPSSGENFYWQAIGLKP